jgi:hypothetical protein
MAEDNTQKDGAQGGQGAGGTTSTQRKSMLVKVDPKKTNEQYIAEAEKHYIIPKLVRETFPDLIKLIFETESMDEEEREYWLQILPIMTEEQIVKFRDILVNEKDQLTKLDQEYQDDISSLDTKKKANFNEEEMRKEREDLRSKEAAHEEAEAQTEEDLLKQLEDL